MKLFFNYYGGGTHKDKNNCKSYDTKLYNNIVRARSKILDYAENNDFTYFFTATISSKYDRTDLKKFTTRLSQCFQDLRKEFKNNLFYLYIPELHKDKKSWHVHGLIGGVDLQDILYLNQYGYWSCKKLDKLGFNSFSRISCSDACNIYITKYVTKELCKGHKKGDRVYFCSKDLKCGEHQPIINFPDKLKDKLPKNFENDFFVVKKFFDMEDLREILQEYYKTKNLDILIDKLNLID